MLENIFFKYILVFEFAFRQNDFVIPKISYNNNNKKFHCTYFLDFAPFFFFSF